VTRAHLARSLAVVDIVAFFVSATLDPTPDYGAGLMYFLGIGAFVSIGGSWSVASRRTRSAF
jgi:hypothetical protein